jgi:hypothetical protein
VRAHKSKIGGAWKGGGKEDRGRSEADTARAKPGKMRGGKARELVRRRQEEYRDVTR